MAYEPREGQGAIFDNRKQSDKQPDMRGDFMLGGQMYEIAGWWKEGRSRFLSIRVQPKQGRRDERPAPAPAPRGGGSAADDMDDEIPFGPDR